ncbi:MAG: hypothetical protein IKB80_03970 [Oscillospiraceae bacterium]|nr:hypothetical protein [Oscillospiraceae bacterium]
MKTRKIIAYILTVAALLGLLAGCGKKDDQPSVPSTDGSNTATKNTESTKTTESTKATETTKATEVTEATQATEATSATEATETATTEAPCIHILGTKWTVTEKATCTNEGSRYKTCTLCGDKVAETIPMLEHEPGPWKQVKGKEATCTKEGVQYQACRQCEEIIIYINTEKKPHTPDATGKCKDCKEVLPTVPTETNKTP